MRNYIFGFITGAAVCLGFMVLLAYGLNALKRTGPCPELSEQQAQDMILEYAGKPGIFSYGGRIIYNGIELVYEKGFGEVVYTIKNGKRITRHFPIIQCGSLEWSSDPEFNRDQQPKWNER